MTGARLARAVRALGCAGLFVAGARAQSDAPAVEGLWIAPAEVRALPARGPAWTNVVKAAAADVTGLDLADQDEQRDVLLYAKALVAVRRGDALRAKEVVAALRALVADPPRAAETDVLAIARNLPAVVIAADLVGLRRLDPELDAEFRALLARLRSTEFRGDEDAGFTLVGCHETRPNNWGTHAGAARLAIALYLGDEDEVARIADVLRVLLGEPAAGPAPVLRYGGPAAAPDLSWQCDAEAPVAVNRAGCGRLDGVLPDEQRRAGPLRWPPPKENYVYEALQGLGVQAALLARHGHDAWAWGDRALARAFEWLHRPQFLPSGEEPYPAVGTRDQVSDDRWLPFLWNAAYGADWPTDVPNAPRPGKNMGFTDWTHAQR